MRWVYFVICFFCCLVSPAQVIENPVFDRTDTPLFHIDKIEMTKDSTFVYCSCFAEDSSWANISPKTYLEDVATRKKYTILKSEGLPFAPNTRKFYVAERYIVKLSFPPLNIIGNMNFIENAEGASFNIYGISQVESNDTIYKKYSLDKANALTASAGYYSSVKKYEKAIESEIQAMYIRKYWLGRYNEMYDHSVFMLGHYYNMIGAYVEAERYLQESVNVREKLYGKDQEPYVDALTMLASSLANQGKVTKAIHIYEQAIGFIDSNSLSYTRAKSLLARAYFAIGDIPKAIDYVEDVVRINKDLVGEKDEEYLYPLLDLARFHMWVDTTKGRAIGEELLSIIRRYLSKTHTLYLLTTNLLSQCCMLQNDSAEALSYAKEKMILSLETFGKESVEYGLSVNLMSQIYEMLFHDYDKAIQYILEEISILKPSMGWDTYSNALRHVSQCYAKINDYANALKYASSAIETYKENIIPEFEKMTNEQKYTLWWQKGHFYFDSGYPLYVFKCPNETTLKELYNNILFSKGITMNEQLSEKSTWEDVRSSLKTDDIALELITSYEQDSLVCFYALAIKKGYESPKMFRLFDVFQFRDLINMHYPAYELNRLLGSLIWGTLKEELHNVKNIFFSPTGLLHQIPIENLPISQLENYSDKYNMYRVSSTKEITKIKPHIHYKNAVLFGGIDYNTGDETISNGLISSRSGFELLMNTEQEVSDISNILKQSGMDCEVLKGRNGSEPAFYKIPNKTINILHMATHGRSVKSEEVDVVKKKDNLAFLDNTNNKSFVYEKNALSWSFLVLAGGNRMINRLTVPQDREDGILTAKEISMMQFDELDLVVLSACETARGSLGYDDSVLGLQKAFKRAGAKSLIMSLGKVDDEATKILMVEFYKNLMNGKTKHQSLRDAQKYLRSVDNGKYDDPKYWASFIMLDGLN